MSRESNAPTGDDPSTVDLVPIDTAGAVAVIATFPDRARGALAHLRHSVGTDGRALAAFDASVEALGAAGTAATGASSAVSALASLQGVVQLAPETLALLSSGNHLMQAAATGQQIGTVVADVGGRVVAHARFVPVGNAVTFATVAASLGPAVALASIQYQLNRLDSLLSEVKTLTQTLLEESRVQRWAQAEARIDRITREVGWVLELGSVPHHLIDNLADDALALHAFALATTELLTYRMKNLSGLVRAKERRDILDTTAHAIARDAVDLSLAANAWLAVEVLRSAHIKRDDDPASQAYAERVYNHALATSQTWRAEAVDTLMDVHRVLSRIAGQEPHTLRRHDRHSSGLARAVTRALKEALPGVEPPELVRPEGTPGLESDLVAPVLQEARWVLDRDATVEALVGVTVNGEPGFRLETTQQILIANLDQFLTTGEVAALTRRDDASDVTDFGLVLSYEKADPPLLRRARRTASAVSTSTAKALGSLDSTVRGRGGPEPETVAPALGTNNRED